MPNETDRQKVLIQITQNLSQHLGNRTFDLPTIYIPVEAAPLLSAPAVAAAKEKVVVPNHIDKLCEVLDETVHKTVQSVLSSLQHDCETGIQCAEKYAADRPSVVFAQVFFQYCWRGNTTHWETF